MHDGACVGCIARNVRDGRAAENSRPRAWSSPTGGAGQRVPADHERIHLPGRTGSRSDGAPLFFMEFNQYHPMTLARVGILITEGARGEGAHLYNARGERFMELCTRPKSLLRLRAGRCLPRRATRDPRGPRVPRRHRAARHHPRCRASARWEALREIVNIGCDFAGVDITLAEPIHTAGDALT